MFKLLLLSYILHATADETCFSEFFDSNCKCDGGALSLTDCKCKTGYRAGAFSCVPNDVDDTPVLSLPCALDSNCEGLNLFIGYCKSGYNANLLNLFSPCESAESPPPSPPTSPPT